MGENRKIYAALLGAGTVGSGVYKLAGMQEEDICLIGEDFLDAFQTEQLLTKVRRPLYLTEAKNSSGIYKYQSIHEMAKAILKLCEEEALLPVKGTAATETKLIAFYSPAHHMLQSSIALTM